MADKYLDERTYEPGDVIFSEGDAGTEMFIVQEGKAVITKNVAGRDVFLAVLERGEFSVRWPSSSRARDKPPAARSFAPGSWRSRVASC